MKMESPDYLIPSGVRIERLLFEPYEKQMKDALSIKPYLEYFIKSGFATEHHALDFRLYYMVISGLAAEEPHFDITNQIKSYNISLSEREFEEFRKLYSLELASNLIETLREFLLEDFECAVRKSKVIIDWLDNDERFKIEDNFMKPTPNNNFDFIDLLELTDDLLRMVYVVSSWMMKTENEFGERRTLLKKTENLSKSFIARDVPSWLSVLAFSLCRYSITLLNYRSIRLLIEEMERPIEIYERCVFERKFSFNRHQLSIMSKGLFKKANIFASCPPGSGKTFLASIHSIINECDGHSGKTVFAVPLIALANEVYSSIESIAPENLQKTLQTSESSLKRREELAREIQNSKIIVATYERLDSIIRNNLLVENDIHTLLIDEFHNIANKTRGIGLDFLTTSLLNSCKEKLLLSAVIPKLEVDNLAKWANTTPVITGKIEKEPEITRATLRGTERKKDFLLRHAERSIQNNYLTLIVCSTRQRCEDLAELAAEKFEGPGGLIQMPVSPESDFLDNIKKREKIRKKFAQRILELELDPREKYKQLAEFIEKGVAFHHAGMNRKLKNIIEEAVGQKAVNVLFSTTTLVEGVNLPIRNIILESIPYLRQIVYYSTIRKEAKSYLSSKEMNLIDGILSTYIQNLRNIIGRAGRPGLEYFPEIISLLPETYNKQLKALGEIERIGTSIDLYLLYDSLENLKERVRENRKMEETYYEGRGRMRSWLLRLIEISEDYSALKEKISKSWFSWKYASDTKMINLIEKKILSDVRSLIEEGFVEEKNENRLILSKFGKITSESLVDPESALMIFRFLNKVLQRYHEGAFTEYVKEKQRRTPNYSEDKLIRIMIFVAMGLSNELIRGYKSLFYGELKEGDQYQMERLATLSLLPEDDLEIRRFFYATRIATLLSNWRKGSLMEEIERYVRAKFLAESFIKKIVSDESIRVLNFISRIGSEILMFPEQFSKVIESLSWQLQYGTFNFDTAELIEFLARNKLGTRETALVIARETKKHGKIFNLEDIKEKSLDEFLQEFENTEKAKIIFEALKKEKN